MSLYTRTLLNAYSVEFREAVVYSLSCLNERNQKSRIRHREIRRVYGIVSKRKLRLPQVFWDKLAHARFDPGSVYQALFPPVTLKKTGPGDEASPTPDEVYSKDLNLERLLVSAPDPTDAAADGLHHRYASVLTRSGDVIHPQLRPLGLGPRLERLHAGTTTIHASRSCEV